MVGAASPEAPVRLSRFCEEFLLYPSPMKDPEGFRHWLFEILNRRRFDLLVGTTDQTLLLLDEWRELLSSLVHVPLPAQKGFRMACDKARTVKQAQELGIAVPPTRFIQSEAELDKAANTLQPPFVIKPRISVGLCQGQRLRLSVAYAFDNETLRQKYFALHRSSPWPLLQSYVAGSGMGCFFLIRNGQILARFMHRRIRDEDPTGSGSSLRIGVAPDPTLMSASERLLRAIGVDGLVMVEYRVAEDGTPYLMEINSRPWGSMQLAVESGVDFPLLWYRAVTGQQVDSIHFYREGVLCRHLAGDLRHLENVLLGPPPQWSLDFPKRLPTFLQFLKFWGMNLRYEDFAAGDWRPGLAELGNYFAELSERFLSRLRRIFIGTRKVDAGRS
jgi:predicted ATP-grasp superfamily ATP-dependent carboligase